MYKANKKRKCLRPMVLVYCIFVSQRYRQRFKKKLHADMVSTDR